jgi:release factor glutamine methyltransferase
VDLPDPLVARLRAAGCVYAEEEAALLRSAATGAGLESLVRRRVAGEPLEVLVGWASFDGLRVATAPGVFVPRARSALLVRLAAEALPPGGVAVDLGCGTGALGAALVHRRPDAEVHAADVDPAAVACARRNLPPERVHEGDLFAALPVDLRGRVEVLVVNAPYVPSGHVALMPPEARDHEPLVALDGGADGLDVQRRVAAGAAAWLGPAGVLVLETSRAQADATLALLADAGLHPRLHRDEDLDATAAVARVAPDRLASEPG